MNILQAIDQFFPQFSGPTWAAWRCYLAAAYCLPIPDMALYTRCTGRTRAFIGYLRQIFRIKGRRAGGSMISALEALYNAVFVDWSQFLAGGEKGYVAIIGKDRKQCRVILGYIDYLIEQVPMIANMVVNRTAESIELSNKIIIEVMTASKSSVRGYKVVYAVLDECAFFPTDDAADSDYSIRDALLPAMAGVPNARINYNSSPHGQFGLMFDGHRDYFGNDEADDTMCWIMPTWVGNPTIDQAFLDKERERNLITFNTEYGCQFLQAESNAYAVNDIDNCLVLEDRPIPRSVHEAWSYFGFLDFSGAVNDAATLAIACPVPDEDQVTICFMKRWPAPFSPEAVAEEMVSYLQLYKLQSVTGDRYAAGLTQELFTKRGVPYRESELTRSDIYREASPLIGTGRIAMPKNDRLRKELVSLQRSPRPGGRDIFDHPRGGTDDLANSVCGAAVLAWQASRTSHTDFELLEQVNESVQLTRVLHGDISGLSDGWY